MDRKNILTELVGKTIGGITRDDRGGFRMRLVAMMTHWSDAVTLCIVNIALAVDRLARPCPDVTPHTYHLTPLVYF